MILPPMLARRRPDPADALARVAVGIAAGFDMVAWAFARMATVMAAQRWQTQNDPGEPWSWARRAGQDPIS